MRFSRRLVVFVWITLCVFLCHVALASIIAFAKEEPDIKVELVVDSRFIRQCDPVLVKVVITNLTDKEQEIVAPEQVVQTLFFSISRWDREDEFDELWDGDGFNVTVPDRFPKMALKPHDQYAVYDRIFRKWPFADFVFPHATSVKLRAGILLGDKKTRVYSEPINMGINTRKKEDRRLIEDNVDAVKNALLVDRIYLTDPKEIPQLESIQAKLSGDRGALPRILRWRIPSFKLKYGSDKERELAKKDLEELRGDLSEPARDMLALSLAKFAVEQKDYAAAKLELARLKHDSAPKSVLEFEISMAEKK